ncbi:hypothetical protein E1267_42465 [Nonomuraea longispora]|uniref:Uncharacterized protein n=1 Tax=Nonomuraea longispora TaxID=1848320 RepID=A0A4R4MLR3_9ACTN|nr:hypothetical protein [Nonomuraea longispora]TDB94836.1 hypothetical protein E1267_42465 [Nonomuraea longispora]
MTMLTYTLLTDPAPLEASTTYNPSQGTAYLVVTNTGQYGAYWSTIDVELPVGNGAGDLVKDVATVKAIKTKGDSQAVTFKQQGPKVFRATPSTGGSLAMNSGDSMVLTLENITVTGAAGVAVLKVTETSKRKTGKRQTSIAMPALVKTATAPRNFRPDESMLDDGKDLVLRWDGSDDFTYEILFPGGKATVPRNDRTWKPGTGQAPKRATTYTLVATSRSDPQRQHVLTTTVHLRNPVLETFTATTGIDTPRVQGTANATGGRLIFTGTGVEISDNSGGQGTVTADKAIVNGGVTTPWVVGPNNGDGIFTFSKGAMHIWSEFGSNERGTLYAGETIVNGVATEYVKGLNTGEGDITFIPGGVKVWRTRGSGEGGTLFAEKADFNGVNAKWVQGKGDRDGWIGFSYYGVNVLRHDGGAGKRWGVIGVHRIDHH